MKVMPWRPDHSKWRSKEKKIAVREYGVLPYGAFFIDQYVSYLKRGKNNKILEQRSKTDHD